MHTTVKNHVTAKTNALDGYFIAVMHKSLIDIYMLDFIVLLDGYTIIIASTSVHTSLYIVAMTTFLTPIGVFRNHRVAIVSYYCFGGDVGSGHNNFWGVSHLRYIGTGITHFTKICSFDYILCPKILRVGCDNYHP